MKRTIIILLTLVCTQTIKAQDIFHLEEKDKTVYTRFGIEPTYVLALGCRKSIQISPINRSLVLYGELSSPTKIMIRNYESKIGGILNVLKLNGFGVTYNLGFSTGHVNTKNFNSQKFAFSNKFLIGHFNIKWFLAFSAEHEKIFANKIKHTTYYREYIFPEAKDGWYKGAGGNIQLGLEFGRSIHDLFDLRLDLKVPKSERFNSYNGSPAHLNLSLEYRF